MQLNLLLVQGTICASEHTVVGCGCCGVEVMPIFAGTRQTALPSTFLVELPERTTI